MVQYMVEYYSAVKNNGIIKFAGKWIELEKNHPKCTNPDLERQISIYSLVRDFSCKVKDNDATIHRLKVAK